LAIFQDRQGRQNAGGKRINSELLVALTFNAAAWVVVGIVAWTLIH
jgi:hypothetical protein